MKREDAPKVWPATPKPAICTLSAPKLPAAPPLPYLIVKGLERFLNVLEADASNVGTPLQPVMQLLEATQRSALPVSRMTLNDLAGVPIAIVPK